MAVSTSLRTTSRLASSPSDQRPLNLCTSQECKTDVNWTSTPLLSRPDHFTAANWLVSLMGSYCAREVIDGFNECERSLGELPHPSRGEQGDLRPQDSVNLTVENIPLPLHRASDMAFCHEDKTVWF